MKAYSKKLRNSINQLKQQAKIFKMIDLECEKERQARSGIHTVDCPFNRPASLVPVPHVGEVRHFFDDGKMSESRHYIATITNVIPYKKAPQKLKNMEESTLEVPLALCLLNRLFHKGINTWI